MNEEINVQNSIMSSFCHRDMENISDRNHVETQSQLQQLNYIDSAQRGFRALQDGALKPPLFYTETEVYEDRSKGIYDETDNSVIKKLQNKEIFPLG